MKKIVALLAVFTCLLSLMPVAAIGDSAGDPSAPTGSTASAEGVAFTVSSAFGQRGDTVTVTVDIAENSQVYCAEFSLLYDDDDLEAVSVQPEYVLGTSYAKIDEPGVIKVACANSSAATEGGAVLTVEFEVRSTDRKTPLELEVTLLSTMDENAAIELSERASGDMNGDQEVNAQDATRILLAANDVIYLTEADRILADIDGNGQVNSVDAARILMQMLGKNMAAQEVALTPVVTNGSVILGAYDYIVENGQATIVGYSKTADSEVDVPTIIDGYPVTAVGYAAFASCLNLTRVTLPEGLTSIADRAFSGCRNLTKVELPGSLTDLAPTAFEMCSRLTDISVEANSQNYLSIDGVLFSKDGKTIVAYPAGREGDYVIPSAVTTIGENAFAYCSGWTWLALPPSVTTIEKGAFVGCTGLQYVVFSEGLTSIGERAFSQCISLQAAAIPPSVTSIGDQAFETVSEAFSIIGEADSYAQTYAEEHNIPFLELGLLGDVNVDGSINAMDATRVLLSSVGKITLDEYQTAAADVNADSKVNAMDATLILLHAVGKRPIES